MLLQEHFHNMKQSTTYIFHNEINCFDIVAVFSLVILYRFSTKYAKVKVAYVGDLKAIQRI